MPPCLSAKVERHGFNESEAVYLLRILNETDTVETTTNAANNYDQTGAMQFIICTVFTYSFVGVFFLLVTRFRQGTTAHQSARTEADAINNYLKSERTLKLEGCKLKMVSEIKKHAEDIKNYEEKLKLLEIEKDIREKNFGVPFDGKRRYSKSFKTGKKQKRAVSSRLTPGKRRLSMPAAFGRMGFSFLFMDSAEETIKENIEEDTNENTNRSDQLSISLSDNFRFDASNQPEPGTVPVLEKVPEEIEYIDV